MMDQIWPNVIYHGGMIRCDRCKRVVFEIPLGGYFGYTIVWLLRAHAWDEHGEDAPPGLEDCRRFVA